MAGFRRKLVFLVLSLGLVFAGLYWALGSHARAWYHLRAAESAMERYRSEEALTHLQICLAAWPEYPRARLLAARACRRLERDEEAEEHLNRIRTASDASADTSLEWAMLRASMGDLRGDVEDFLQTKARAEPENAPLIWEALATGYMRMFRSPDAITCLNLWLEQQPDNPQAYFLRGSFYRHMGAMQKAAPDFRRAVELDPERLDAHEQLGIALLEIGRFDEALEHLEIVRGRRPDDILLEIRRARCLGQLGRSEEAISILNVVLAKEPENASALRVRGETALLSGQATEAESWFRKAVKAAPGDYSANWHLYQALLQNGKQGEAEKQLANVQHIKDLEERVTEIRRQLSARPNDPALPAEMGQLQLQLGNKDLGERWLLNALTKDPSYSPAHVGLAQFYAAEGKSDKAAYHREQASKGKPAGGASPPAPDSKK
jgi:tetratricopeptide (TPR) repeat protein